ncbi:MAG: hypothetical protein ACYC3L_14710 [Gemmatimonadaceae bacterium]
MTDQVDKVLEQLARDVETAVHALYRGDVRQETANARTGHLVRDAAALLRGHVPAVVETQDGAVSPRTPASRPSVAGAALGWTDAEGEAVMKCVTAWLPMGAPSTAAPESKCIAAGREMVPTWKERELARGAVRKLNPV